MKKIAWWAGLALVIAFAVTVPYYLVRADKEDNGNGRSSTVLVLWHVDSFEGGTGSRQDFLMKSALGFERENKGVYVSVIKHTEESVKENLARGSVPDMISFGCGVFGVAEYAKPLKTHKNNLFFNACEYAGRLYCYPYAYGVYAEYKLGKGEGVAVSRGKNNLSLFAAMRAGKKWDDALEPIECYTRLLTGKYGCVIGTQRDAYRLIRRGVEFECEGIDGFTDLVQYVAVTAEGDRADIAARFAGYLVSDAVQCRLGEIGLFSPTGVPAEYEDEAIARLSKTAIDAVLPPFLPENEWLDLRANDGQYDFFEKFGNYLKD